MSIETNLGQKIFELRDFVKSQLIVALIDTSTELDWGLNAEQLSLLKIRTDASVDVSFDRGLNNILSVIREKEKPFKEPQTNRVKR
jgi:hypothetical protein